MMQKSFIRATLFFGLCWSVVSQARSDACTESGIAATVSGLKLSCRRQTVEELRRLLESGSYTDLSRELNSCGFVVPWGYSVIGWVLHNVPRRAVQDVGRDLIYRSWNFDNGPILHTESDAQNLIRPWAERETPMSPGYLAQVDHNFTEGLSPRFGRELNLARQASSSLCLYLGSLHDCKTAVELLVRLMDVKSERVSGGGVSLTAALQEFLKSPFDHMVVARIAQVLYQRSIERPSEAHFFRDVEDVYRRAWLERGLSQIQAQRAAYESTWNLMGLYSTRGMSWLVLSPLVPAERKPVLLILSEIGRLLARADALWTTFGRAYSYPSQMKMSCYHGRPYHFWMTAFFARYLNIQKNRPQWNSFSASFIPGLLYEVGSATWGRSPLQPFTVPFDDGYNQGIRQNLVLKKMGAKWGAESGSRLFEPSQKWSFDELFLEQVDSGRPVSLEPEEVHRLPDHPEKWFLNFNQLFEPFQGLMDYYGFDRRRPAPCRGAHCPPFANLY